MSILKETQNARDIELSKITGVPLDSIREMEVASKKSTCIFSGKRVPETEEEFLDLYHEFKYLDIVAYYRTLMYTSVFRRGKNLLNLLKTTHNKTCLDFGSGVGTHGIALLENGNFVHFYDVEGPLKHFAMKRVISRGFRNGFTFLSEGFQFLREYYDVIICTDVLEHVFDPPAELERITTSLKRGGILHLQVSSMIKNSKGHFKSSNLKWVGKGIPILQKKYDRIMGSRWRKK